MPETKNAPVTRPLGAQISHMLKARGVDVIFGIPGVHNQEMYRGIEEAGITHVLARHEQGAGFMADGYARVSGRHGVVIGQNGPGISNCVTAIAAAFWLWVISGFGWKLRSPAFQRAHYQVLRLALAVVVALGRRLFSLEIDADGEDLPGYDGDPTTHESPLIVMSRHAGPADSILLMHEIMSWRGRQPRIVAKDLLQLDPMMDIYLNRLPNRFISSDPSAGKRSVEAIRELASDMTNQDAFVIFPEGANFTPRRRLRAIDRLRKDGHEAAAARAAKLRNVLPPRPAGTMAAIAAAPDADAVLVAHTGLDDLATVGDLWYSIPTDKTIELAWQVVPADFIPDDPEEQEEMLFLAWEAIDAWIEARRG